MSVKILILEASAVICITLTSFVLTDNGISALTTPLPDNLCRVKSSSDNCHCGWPPEGTVCKAICIFTPINFCT